MPLLQIFWHLAPRLLFSPRKTSLLLPFQVEEKLKEAHVLEVNEIGAEREQLRQERRQVEEQMREVSIALVSLTQLHAFQAVYYCC